MTIKKKPGVTIKRPSAPGGGAAQPVSGVADRFKLNAPSAEQLKAARAGRKAATVTLVFALIALAVAGILTYIMWQHWEFLMPA